MIFCELNATNEQLDFPIIYGIAKNGIAKYSMDDENADVKPLLDTIINKYEYYKGNPQDNLQLQVSNLEYDEYIGRLGTGRITKEVLKGETVSLVKNDGSTKLSKLLKYLLMKEYLK